MVRQHSDRHAVHRADDLRLAEPDSDCNTDPYPNTYIYPNADNYTHSYTDADADSYTNSYSYSYTDTYAYPHTNTNSNAPFRHTDTGTHHDTYPER
jgi:hypothetical protein